MDSITFRGKPLRKVANIALRRLSDGTIFRICSPCVLRLPDELVHVIGLPIEELDTDIWDVRQKFDVLEIAPIKE